ncbi:unnamed protein product [Trichobilharzia regenti]|nr:unnamed protein product [Trichobilharzia regenti]
MEVHVLYEKWPYRNSPWDTFKACIPPRNINSTESSNYDRVHCIISSFLGAWSGYILPIACGLGLIINTFISITIFMKIKLMPRYMIYMAFVAIMSMLTNIIFGWLWLFPAKGVPYITNGKRYYIVYNVSPIACQSHRFLSSFTSTCSCNLLVCAALDRFFSIYFPTQFNKLPKYYAWCACGLAHLLSFIMMLPLFFTTDIYFVESKLQCSMDPNNHAIQLYQALFSNLGFVQSLILVALNCAFLRLICKRLKETTMKRLNAADRKQIQTSIFFLVYSASYTVTSLPQTVAYITGRLSISVNSSKFAFHIADIFWNFHFTREVFDFFIYFKFFRTFRLVVLNVCKPCHHRMQLKFNE